MPLALTDPLLTKTHKRLASQLHPRRQFPDVLLGDPAAGDGDVAESYALETPDRVTPAG